MSLYVQKYHTERTIEINKEQLKANEIMLEQEKKKKEKVADAISRTQIEIGKTTEQIESNPYTRKKEDLKRLLKEKELLEGRYQDYLDVQRALGEWKSDPDVFNELDSRASTFIDEFCSEKTPSVQLSDFKHIIKEEKERIHECCYQPAQKKAADLKYELQNLKDELEGYLNDRKKYLNPNTDEARRYLDERLSNIYHKRGLSRIFSRCFEVTDLKWKDAIEGRLSQKASIIVPPQYFSDASKIWKESKHKVKNVKLINSEKISKEKERHQAKPNSLYECVSKEEPYIDDALQYFLGNIIKCDSEEEVRRTGNSVTADCFTQDGNQVFHIPEKHYKEFASIGKEISKEKIQEIRNKIQETEENLEKATKEVQKWKYVPSFEDFSNINELRFFSMIKTKSELESCLKEEKLLNEEIEMLETQGIQHLKNQLKEQEDALISLKEESADLEDRIISCNRNIGRNNDVINSAQRHLEALPEFEASEDIIQKSNIWIEKNSRMTNYETISATFNEVIANLKKTLETLCDGYRSRVAVYITNYPMDNIPQSTTSESVLKVKELYLKKLKDVDEDLITLYDQARLDALAATNRDIVEKLAKEIKNAHRFKKDINDTLRNHPFGPTTFELSISRADGIEGEFYDLLNSPFWGEFGKKISTSNDLDQLSISDLLIEQEFGERTLEAFLNNFRLKEETESNEAYNKRIKKFFDYRTYLKFELYERYGSTGSGSVVGSKSYSGGENATNQAVAFLTGFHMLYNMYKDPTRTGVQTLFLDEAFSETDLERTAAAVAYAREHDFQTFLITPDKELESLKTIIDRSIFFTKDESETSHCAITNYKKVYRNSEKDDAE